MKDIRAQIGEAAQTSGADYMINPAGADAGEIHTLRYQTNGKTLLVDFFLTGDSPGLFQLCVIEGEQVVTLSQYGDMNWSCTQVGAAGGAEPELSIRMEGNRQRFLCQVRGTTYSFQVLSQELD